MYGSFNMFLRRKLIMIMSLLPFCISSTD